MDPIGYESDVNPYAYVKEDPANESDPSGTDEAGNTGDQKWDNAVANAGSAVYSVGGSSASGAGVAIAATSVFASNFGASSATAGTITSGSGGAGTAGVGTTTLEEVVVSALRTVITAASQVAQGALEVLPEIVTIARPSNGWAGHDYRDEASPMYAEEHTKGSRSSTKGKHEKGQARKNRDNRNEKGDERRDPRGKRPDDHRGQWPPPKVKGETGASNESDE